MKSYQKFSGLPVSWGKRGNAAAALALCACTLEIFTFFPLCPFPAGLSCPAHPAGRAALPRAARGPVWDGTPLPRIPFAHRVTFSAPLPAPFWREHHEQPATAHLRDWLCQCRHQHTRAPVCPSGRDAQGEGFPVFPRGQGGQSGGGGRPPGREGVPAGPHWARPLWRGDFPSS